jgi:hypothetical protein
MADLWGEVRDTFAPRLRRQTAHSRVTPLTIDAQNKQLAHSARMSRQLRIYPETFSALKCERSG